MKSLKILPILITFALLIIPGRALAQTPSPDQATTSSAELRRAIRERIEETLKDKDVPTQNFLGYIGTITQVGSATFSITCPRGDEKTIQILDGTTLLANGKPITLSDLVVGNGVTVMGTRRDELIIEARRVLMSTDNFTENRQITLGNISALEKQAITLQPRGDQPAVTWPTTRQTAYEDLNGQKITVAQLEEDQSVLVISDVDKDDKRFIKRLRLLVPVTQP
jgi:hypothetical protein